MGEVALVSDADTIDENRDVVTLLTLHTAKGLEYKVVFITGVEENLLPHSRSTDELDSVIFPLTCWQSRQNARRARARLGLG